jgi:glycerol uptake facilitator-like aquaporin
MTLFLCHLVAVPIDGCSVNPARSFGTAVVSVTWENHWIFWVAPLIGGCAAGVLYELLPGKNGEVHGGPVEDKDRLPPAGPHNYNV